MFPVFQFSESEILSFALVLLRILAFLFTWPLFSVFHVPQPLKVLLGLMLTVVVFPSIDRSAMSMELLNSDLPWLAAKEVLIGICLGFMTRMIFFAVAVGASIVSATMGMANAQMFNPSLQEQSSTMEQFFAVVATLFFLSINGHHVFVTGLIRSFEFVPLSSVGINIASFQGSGAIMQQIMVSGVKISAPVLAIIFISNMGMGVIGRAVPQINVLVTSLPVNILAGLLILFVTIPVFVPEVEMVLRLSAENLFAFMKAM